MHFFIMTIKLEFYLESCATEAGKKDNTKGLFKRCGHLWAEVRPTPEVH